MARHRDPGPVAGSCADVVPWEGPPVRAAHGPGARRTVTTIVNGVDVERLRATVLPAVAAREALGLPSGVPVVGTVGGLTPKKGHVTLVRAIPGVLRAHPETRFVFVGLPVDEEPVRRA